MSRHTMNDAEAIRAAVHLLCGVTGETPEAVLYELTDCTSLVTEEQALAAARLGAPAVSVLR